MDKKEILTHLAVRMGTTEEQAAVWFAAVLEELHGAYVADGVAELAVEPGAVKVAQIEPVAPVLRSITPTARLSIGEEIVIDRFPFRVGREGRAQPPTGIRAIMERKPPASKVTNELYVKDFGKSVNVSREHFQIEDRGDGSYELVDRGSACGTIVGDRVVGGNFIGGRCQLTFGDSIIVGTRQSAIVFEFSRTGT